MGKTLVFNVLIPLLVPGLVLFVWRLVLGTAGTEFPDEASSDEDGQADGRHQHCFARGQYIFADRAGTSFALLLGFLAAYIYFVTLQWAAFFPTQLWQWILWLVVLAAVLGPIGLARGVTFIESGFLRLLVAFAAAYLLDPRWIEPDSLRLQYRCAVGIGIFVISHGIEFLADRGENRSLVFLLTVNLIAAAVVVMLSGNGKLAQVTTAMAAATGGTFFAMLPARSPISFRGAVTCYSVCLVSTLFLEFAGSYADIPTASYALIAVAPLALCLCELPKLRTIGPKRRFLLKSVVIGTPLAIGLALAVIADIRANQEESSVNRVNYSARTGCARLT